MKRLTKPTLAISLAMILLGCSKNNSEKSPVTDQTEIHSYGVLPMQPEQWSYVPVFSTEIILENARTSGLPVKTLPSSYLLASPTIRNQGRIGSCTAFCGAGTGEMLNYHKTNTAIYTGLRVFTDLTKASITQVVNSSCYENLYAYPSTGSHSSTQYTTPPTASAISNAASPYSVLRSKTIVSSGRLYVAII